MQVALSPFALLGTAPLAVRTWTFVAALLVQVGESLPLAMPLIIGAAATLRLALSRRVVAGLILVSCVLAAHWLRPAADLAADRRMPRSVAAAPARDFREFTSLELLRAADQPGIDPQQVAIARGVLWLRVASELATAMLLVPLIAVRRRVALRWFVAPCATAVLIGLNLVAFQILAPRLAAPSASLLWIVAPAAAVADALWIVMNRSRADGDGS